MHAEHADKSELNELSGRVIGCAFTVINTRGSGFLDAVPCQTRGPWPVKGAGSSACSACIVFLYLR
jgi:hypothetical protein